MEEIVGSLRTQIRGAGGAAFVNGDSYSVRMAFVVVVMIKN